MSLYQKSLLGDPSNYGLASWQPLISKASEKLIHEQANTFLNLENLTDQGRSMGNSSLASEVLIINYQIYFINLFVFSYLTLNIKLFIFKLFEVKFLFSENHVFCKQKRTAVYGLMDAHPQFRILNSPGKMMTCYLRDINKFLRYRTLCKSILKCGFPTKGIKLTRLVFFEVLGVPQL